MTPEEADALNAAVALAMGMQRSAAFGDMMSPDGIRYGTPFDYLSDPAATWAALEWLVQKTPFVVANIPEDYPERYSVAIRPKYYYPGCEGDIFVGATLAEAVCRAVVAAAEGGKP